MSYQECPHFRHLWATVEEEELSQATLNILQHIITKKKSHNVFHKFTILCWAAFTAILSCPGASGWTPLIEYVGDYLIDRI